MAIGELLLSAFFQVLFDRLTSPDLLNFVRRLQGRVDLELEKWKDILIMIHAVLSDAEEKQLTDRTGAVKIWLDDLQDLAYDAEDILDEFTTEALKRKLNAEQDQESTSKIHHCFPAAAGFNCFNSSNTRMDSKIKSITNRFEQLCQKITLLGLQRPTGGTSAAAPYRPPSSSVPTERAVYGRDEDKANILKLVLIDQPSDSNFLVVPIVGMAGIGKTTLAREVYNDKMIDDYKFDIKAWACVSDDFDVLGISRSLLASITSTACDKKTINEVQVELRKVVDGKKILLVLDDVWNEDYSLWKDLKAPFLAASPDSKIIVTTRHSRVASTMGPIQHYNLKHISDDDCWSLFKKHAFEGRDINAYQISELRNKVVGKCGGLPLAAKTLGGLLRSNRDEAWDDILNTNILNFPQQNGILPVLQLSYHYLPSHLKRCFAYCALFPKDYEFHKNELVLLWIAEGIVQQSRSEKRLEVWGSQCFDDLVSRSIFQQSNSDTSKFIMHDLVHDLTQLVSGETIFKLEEVNKSSRRFERIRHSSYIRGWYDAKKKFEVFHNVEHLRTFLPVRMREASYTSYISYTVAHDLLPKLKMLRAISLQGYQITQLPDSIKDLRLLRYLNLAGTMIRSLPESTSSLFNLQILILRDCSRLIKLPSKMRNLINLHHLDLEGAILLKEMPFGMKQLKNLQKLSNFIVGKGGTVSGLKDLKILKFLAGELCISGLENLNDLQDARGAALCEKLNLEGLSLSWGPQFDNSRDKAAEENLLDMLQPHKNVKRLTIKYYGGSRFPIWIGDPLFSKMEVLTLENSENCKSLPSLGLLGSLKHLTIKSFTKLQIINSEIYGKGCPKPFQSLETLRFENLYQWEYWDTNIEGNKLVEAFSSLRELSIVECPKLSGKVPELLPSLETLVVSNCAELIVSFPSYPALFKLEVDRCKGMVCTNSPIDSKSIKSMTISSSALNIYGCKGMFYNSTSELLKSVTISNIFEFGKFLKQGFQIVDTLATADSELRNDWWWTRIFEFKKLVEGLRLVTCPKEVSIEEKCVSLVSFPEINFLPNNVRSLWIGNNTALKSLPEEMMGNNSQLESLYVKSCNSLTFIGRRKLPSSLKLLEVDGCQNLQRLVDEDVKDAPSSSSSSVTLKHLEISNCPELTTLLSGIQLLEALEYLDISNCPKLETLPDGLHNIKCLRHIAIHQCLSLTALPDEIHKLNSLRYLGIDRCPNVVSFPEEGFPTNLTSFLIGDIKIYKAVIQWGLHRLTSLTFLGIWYNNEAESFPDEEMGMMLPSTLEMLSIRGLQKLKYLSSMVFQSLASLESLSIYNCPKLKSFPESGLPSSLGRLYITDCPLLKKQCKRDKGKEWPKISHIPYIKIDGKFIYEEERDLFENKDVCQS